MWIVTRDRFLVAGQLPDAVPEPLNCAGAAIMESLDAGRLAERVARASLNCVSTEGFDPPPPPRPRRSLTDDSVVRADPEVDIAWIDRDGQGRMVAAHGHAFTTSLNRAELRDLLRALRTPTRVIALPLSERADTRSMLDALDSVGGISRSD